MQRIAVFASGKGSNAKALCRYFVNHPRYRVSLILCDRKDAGVYDVASEFNVPAINILAGYNDGGNLLGILKESRIDFVLLAGYLRLVPTEIIENYKDRILNIHPALLPSFGGKGMYGIHVHKAVIESGAMESGFTIHVVDPHYDEGKIVFQEKIKIMPGIDAIELQSIIGIAELKHYPIVAEKYFDLLNQKS